jgi:hypothetical protein
MGDPSALLEIGRVEGRSRKVAPTELAMKPRDFPTVGFPEECPISDDEAGIRTRKGM